MSFKYAFVLALVSLPASVLAAQERSFADLYADRVEAQRLISAQSVDAAATLFRRLAGENPVDGDLFLGWARASSGAGRLEEALDPYQRAFEMGFGDPVQVAWEIAALQTQLGNREEAIRWIERSLAARLGMRDRLKTSATFASLADDPRFRELAGFLPDRSLRREEGWRHDLAYLVDEVGRLHANPERPAASVEFKEAVQRLHADIPRLADGRILVEMQRLVASLGDGHSVVYPMPTDRVSVSMLPVRFYEFPDGLYVTHADEHEEELVGREVVRIGSMSTEEVLRRLEPLISRDNPMGLQWIRPSYLTIPLFLQAVGAVGPDGIVTLGVRDASGRLRDVDLKPGEFRRPSPQLAPPNSGRPPRYLERRDEYYWMEPVPELDALYIQFNQVLDSPDRTIETFADSVDAEVRRMDPGSLILDLRLNNGGSSYVYQPLVKSAVHFERGEPDRRIYALIGRGTFSAGQNFINDVERFTDVIMVGEPTGSSPNMIGGETTVILPFSGVQASISARIYQDSHARDHRIWIAPDVPVTLTAKAYFSQRDPVLEAVSELILAAPR